MELTFDAREFVNKTKRLLRTPTAFYQSVEKEHNWKEAFTYSIVISIIAALFGILEVTILYPLFQNQLTGVFTPETKPQLLDIIPAFFLSAIIVILLGFVWSWVLYIWLRICKFKGGYWNAYKAYTYSRAPMSLFGWIPVIGGLFGLYSIYLLVVGLSVHYKMTRIKAFLLLLVPMIFLFVLQTVLYTVATQVMP